MNAERATYFFGLDLVRFGAAISVALFHLTWQNPASWWVMPFGWVGVEIFFVLSGFVIANSANGTSPLKFLEGRIARLYPAAWACAPITCAIILSTNYMNMEVGVFADIRFWPLVGSLTLLGPEFLTGAYWTLPVELAFYATIFCLLIVKRFDRVQMLAIGLVLWCVPFYVLLAAYHGGVMRPAWFDPEPGPPKMLLLRHGTFFAMGMLIWLWHQRLLSRAGAAALGLGLLLALMEIYWQGASAATIVRVPFGTPAYDSLTMMLGASTVFLTGAVLIASSAHLAQRITLTARTQRIVRLIGLMTYPFYLLHEAIGGNVMALLQRELVPLYVALAIALVSIAAASFMVVQFAEPAIRAVLRRFMRRFFDWLTDRTAVARALAVPGGKVPASSPVRQ